MLCKNSSAFLLFDDFYGFQQHKKKKKGHTATEDPKKRFPFSHFLALLICSAGLLQKKTDLKPKVSKVGPFPDWLHFSRLQPFGPSSD
jgi:hypothetical protein